MAEAIGRSGRTVSLIRGELVPPLTFQRTRAAAATEAKEVNGAARRAQLQFKAWESAAGDGPTLALPFYGADLALRGASAISGIGVLCTMDVDTCRDLTPTPELRDPNGPWLVGDGATTLECG